MKQLPTEKYPVHLKYKGIGSAFLKPLMKIQTTRPFDEDYHSRPEVIKERTIKQLTLLLENPHHPSLHLKKIKGHPTIWEGRIIKSYRFTFKISGQIYLLRRVGTHDILKTP